MRQSLPAGSIEQVPYNLAMPVLRCPICETEFSVPTLDDAAFRPFCSKRCKMIDLGQWASESYRIPAGVNHSTSSDDNEA